MHAIMKSAGVAALIAVAASAAAAQTTSPAPSMSQAEIERSAREAVSHAAQEPAKLALVGGEIGWVKYCEADSTKCIVSRGFAPGPIYPTKMQLTFETQKVNKLYRIRVLLPLSLELDTGFAVSFGTPTAYIGTYKSCSMQGCFGDVFLTQAAFDKLANATVVDVVVRTDTGRNVTIEGPMEGFAAALAKVPDKAEDILAKEQDINKRLVAEIDANREKREAAEKAAAVATQNPPPASSSSSQ